MSVKHIPRVYSQERIRSAEREYLEHRANAKEEYDADGNLISIDGVKIERIESDPSPLRKRCVLDYEIEQGDG